MGRPRFAVVLLLPWCLSACGKSQTAPEATPPEPSAVVEKETPVAATPKPKRTRPADFKVGDEQLCKEYAESVEGANKKYERKTLEIQGMVKGLEPGLNDDVEVNLWGWYVEGEFEGGPQLNCRFPVDNESYEKVRKLSRRQKITVRGELYLGNASLIRFSECELVDAGDPTEVKLTAEALAKGFEKRNPPPKLLGQHVLVEGTIAEADNGKRMVLTGTRTAEGMPIPVHVSYLKRDAAGFRNRTVGQKVKIDGNCAGYSLLDEVVKIQLGRIVE